MTAKDLLSLREISSHFGVRYSKVISWIELGLLQAKHEQTRTGRPIYTVEFEALQKFCKQHRNLLITRRQSGCFPGHIDRRLPGLRKVKERERHSARYAIDNCSKRRAPTIARSPGKSSAKASSRRHQYIWL